MLYRLLTLVMLGLDTCIKNTVEDELPYNEPREAAGGKLIIRRYYNYGVALEGLKKYPHLVAMISTFLTVLALLFSKTVYGDENRPRGSKIGYGLFLGGALSNTFDRIFRRHVVDYFSFNVKWEKLRRVIFNVSDFAIFIGGILFSLFAPEKK